MNLTNVQKEDLLKILKIRFESNTHRHQGIDWTMVEEKLLVNQNKLLSLFLMEQSGGEPDVVQLDSSATALVFIDCSAESPLGRRSLCYDKQALDKRKDNKPKSSVQAEVEQMGVSLLSEPEYHQLQAFGPFDTKTSSWIKTPESIRKLGGALFGDYRYGRVFIYHNGAESYYAARGFRCKLEF
jgi:hypothetical protein